MADMPVMQDLYAMSEADITRQYSSVGKAPTATKAFVEIDLILPDGTPLTGIPLANVTLVDAAAQPVPGVIGPYFFGSVGDIDPAVTTATSYGTPARSRAAFLDVPAGTYTVQVVRPGMAGNVTDTTTVITSADGATLSISGAQAPATGITDPHFSTDIYPKLQKAANGGLGCANCHTAGGAAAVLPYDDPAATVLTHMNAATGVINLATPATSLFLTKPLYEQPPTPQDHPNATFLDVTDPNYKLFLLWITNGAKP
jgi:hypothetical protein